MSWYPDLGTVTLIDEGEHVRAVGWLAAPSWFSSKKSFPKGETSIEFLLRLYQFAKLWGDSSEALGWGMFLGVHGCELCNKFQAGGNFGVPAGELLYVAPEMITHYVEVHQYRPPVEFVTAVMNSPLPGTVEYSAAVAPFRELHAKQIKLKYEIL